MPHTATGRSIHFPPADSLSFWGPHRVPCSGDFTLCVSEAEDMCLVDLVASQAQFSTAASRGNKASILFSDLTVDLVSTSLCAGTQSSYCWNRSTGISPNAGMCNGGLAVIDLAVQSIDHALPSFVGDGVIEDEEDHDKEKAAEGPEGCLCEENSAQASHRLYVNPWTECCLVDLEQSMEQRSMTSLVRPLMRVLHPVSSLLNSDQRQVSNRKRSRIGDEFLALTQRSRRYYEGERFAICFAQRDSADDACAQLGFITRRVHAAFLQEVAQREVEHKPPPRGASKKAKRKPADLASLWRNSRAKEKLQCTSEIAGRSDDQHAQQEEDKQDLLACPTDAAEIVEQPMLPAIEQRDLSPDAADQISRANSNLVETHDEGNGVDPATDDVSDFEPAIVNNEKKRIVILFPTASTEFKQLGKTMPREPIAAHFAATIDQQALSNLTLLAALTPFAHRHLLIRHCSGGLNQLSSRCLEGPADEPIFLLSAKSSSVTPLTRPCTGSTVITPSAFPGNGTTKPLEHPEQLGAFLHIRELLLGRGMNFAEAEWSARCFDKSLWVDSSNTAVEPSAALDDVTGLTDIRISNSLPGGILLGSARVERHLWQLLDEKVSHHHTTSSLPLPLPAACSSKTSEWEAEELFRFFVLFHAANE